jgi:uncharacterized protein (TIGR00304 family)
MKGGILKMNRNLVLASVLLVLGIMILGYSVTTGEGTASIFIFIPVFYGSGLFAFLGVLCIMAAMILGFIGFSERMEDKGSRGSSQKPTQSDHGRPRSSIKGGGVVLVGPIPIVFGSDPKTAMVLIILALVVMVAAIILIYFSLVY